MDGSPNPDYLANSSIHSLKPENYVKLPKLFFKQKCEKTRVFTCFITIFIKLPNYLRKKLIERSHFSRGVGELVDALVSLGFQPPAAFGC